jgi:hypothetical protein
MEHEIEILFQKNLALQGCAFYLAQKAKKGYRMLLAALGADQRAGLRIASSNNAVGVFDELTAIALDLLYCHACPTLSGVL